MVSAQGYLMQFCQLTCMIPRYHEWKSIDGPHCTTYSRRASVIQCNATLNVEHYNLIFDHLVYPDELVGNSDAMKRFLYAHDLFKYGKYTYVPLLTVRCSGEHEVKVFGRTGSGRPVFLKKFGYGPDNLSRFGIFLVVYPATTKVERILPYILQIMHCARNF